jgi:hypothetical protein
LTLGPPGDRIIDGVIEKEGAHAKTNRDRWFVLERTGLLHYTEGKDVSHCLGTIFLNGCALHKEDILLEAKLQTAFSLTSKKGVMELHRGRTYRLRFKSTHDMRDWEKALAEQIELYKTRTVMFKEGYLEKRGHVNTDWARRFFIALGPLVLYFKDENSRESQGFLLLKAIIRVDQLDSHDTLRDRTRPYSFRIQHASRDIVCSAPTQTMMDDWISVLRGASKGANEK